MQAFWERKLDRQELIRDVIKEAGGGAALARRYEVDRSTVSAWVARGRIPYEYAYDLAELTGRDPHKLADTKHRKKRAREMPDSMVLRAIERIGLTRESAAAALGVSAPSMIKWLSRGYAPPSRIMEIARKSGVPWAELARELCERTAER
jgi:transposase